MSSGGDAFWLFEGHLHVPNKPPITWLGSANRPRWCYTFHKQFFKMIKKIPCCPYFLYSNGASSYQSLVCPVVQLSVAVGMFQCVNGLQFKFKARIEWMLLAWTISPFQRMVGYSNINIVFFDWDWTKGSGLFSRTSPISKLLPINTTEHLIL